MIPRKVRRRARIYRERGLARSARIMLDTAALRLLRLIFNFAPWHAYSPTSLRPYRRGLAAFLSALEPGCVVEVGCGLGSILARIRAEQRYGYDVDPGVVRAARFLRGRHISFYEGGFPEISQPRIDILLAVNWPHDFPPAQIEAWILPLLPRVRYLMTDRIEATSPLNYRHYHDFAFLEGRATAVREESFGEEHRRFILYEVIR